MVEKDALPHRLSCLSLTNKPIRTYFVRDKEKRGAEELSEEAKFTEITGGSIRIQTLIF